MSDHSSTPPAEFAISWELSYLRGRAEAFRRGRLPLAQVASAVHVALRRNATIEDVQEVLAMFALEWNGGELQDTRIAGVIQPRR